MNTKGIGKDIKKRAQRIQFLRDNAHGVEEKGYMKPYTPEELQGHKEQLANTMIQISAIEAELAEVKAEFKGKLKPLREKQSQMVGNIKAKAEYVTEECYRFTDDETRVTSFYNADGDCIEERPATADELQPNLFKMTSSVSLATGTDGE